MISASRVWIWAIPAIMLGASSHATLFVFNDLTDTPSVTINGSTISGSTTGVTNYIATGESISFTTTLEDVVSGANLSFVYELTDPGTSTVSDLLRLTFHANSTAVDVQYGSDPNLPAIQLGDINLGARPEDGTQQQVIIVTTTGAQDGYFIQSDIDELPPDPNPMPEPTTLALLGLGLAGLGFSRRKNA